MIDDGTRRCDACGGRVHPNHTHQCHYPGVRAALEQRGVKVTDDDEKMLRWMAGWDRPTCDWFVSVVTRAASAGVGHRLSALLHEGSAQRVELVCDNPDLVHNELVRAGATSDTPVMGQEIGCSGGERLRWRQGSVRIGETPVLIKTVMAPVTCRDPRVDLGDVGDEWPSLVDQGGEAGGA